MDFIHIWQNGGLWSEILLRTTPIPVGYLEAKVTDVEFRYHSI